jgi:hypothetical protein
MATVNNVTALIVNELIPQQTELQASFLTHLNALIADFPETPVEVAYTKGDFVTSWDKHMYCRLAEQYMQTQSDSCKDDLQYVQPGTAAYDAKVDECTSKGMQLNNQTLFCNEIQIQMEYYACVRWQWQETSFGQCDEARHAFHRELEYIKDMLNKSENEVSKLYDMLCSVDSLCNEDSPYCSENYTGSNFTFPEAPECPPATDEHPCTDVWEEVLNKSFPKTNNCKTCWGVETVAPSPFPTPVPTVAPSPAICDQFENSNNSMDVRVSFFEHQQAVDNSTLAVLREFLLQMQSDPGLTAMPSAMPTTLAPTTKAPTYASLAPTNSPTTACITFETATASGTDKVDYLVGQTRMANFQCSGSCGSDVLWEAIERINNNEDPTGGSISCATFEDPQATHADKVQYLLYRNSLDSGIATVIWSSIYRVVSGTS